MTENTTEQTTPRARAGGRRVLIVHAHPDARSLTAALAGLAAEELRGAGHQVRTSDLYAMKWKATTDADDFPGWPRDDRLDVMGASHHAHDTGTLTADVREEQEKLRWADAVIIQFPLWWFSVPAILKGWLDRVFGADFAYGPGVRPYGGGELAGRRVLLSVTHGAGAPSVGPRGIHGPLSELLFPIQHGVLFFTGMSVLEPFTVPKAPELDEAGFRAVAAAYRARLAGLFTERPLPYRRLTEEDYTRELELRLGRERPGASGLGLHLA
ncbi:flavodoxin family protein [Streptomyces sp. 3MP-14]|uniref:Flavodoxin family protein n=1 Tax=Streptomyces mimosae TaxID=2586635 RepID=A0A5N6AFV3_9ACTN|nr:MULTISPECIES: NAD(P)H-dependent oxidoreductase [Streptomyces]KAB8167727.1 flavodoxin family protein [Streptomyces mimosae]KAB8177626.1 flavodoxin family protein [Streptomyces sp. 3MP-14]